MGVSMAFERDSQFADHDVDRWYTTIMSSGGVALIIFNLPYAVKPLWIVGTRSIMLPSFGL